mmetsp:Transcript_6310/g.15560  ORF Transcript_6310/g.15560 Transcript_6310/m.15560 type:complete len:321 (+) Transcript_6310:74-1036(+)
MLFSFLIASVSAGPTSTAPINRCINGAVDHEFLVTLKPPAANSNGRRLDTTEDKLSFLQGWVEQYTVDQHDPEGTTRRKLEANSTHVSNCTHILHFFTETQFAVDVRACDEAIARMAEDPAVDSIECDCLEHVDMSLPATPDLDEAVARRLTVHNGPPWGLDRIDGVDDNSYDDGDLTGGGMGVRVYVVDTGIQGSHVDFGGRVVNGHTSLERNECASCQAVNGILPADGTGCGGHGTHVASTVGGLDYGVAKEVTLVPAFSCFSLRCSDGRYRCGSGSDIRANLEYVPCPPAPSRPAPAPARLQPTACRPYPSRPCSHR